MTEFLQTLLNISQEAMIIGFIVFLRVGAVMAILPAFGERSVPERVRFALAFAFTLIVAPAVSPLIKELPQVGSSILLLLFGEVIIGLALGLIIRMFVLALQIAGAIAAQSTSLSQIFGTNAIEPLPAIGHVMVISGLALAVMSGFHVRVAEGLIGSYMVFPAGQLPSPSIVTEWGIGHAAKAFSLAFTLAAPFVIVSLVYNLALGVINRAMPQLMVAFVGAPAITAGGLLLLFLSAPILLKTWQTGLLLFLDNPFQAAR